MAENNPATRPAVDEDDSISLIEMIAVLAKHKRLLVGLPLLAALVGLGVSFILPKIYTAKTVLMTPQQSQSGAAAMLGQLGALAGAAGGAIGVKSPAEMYLGLLKSRSVADRLLERFELQKIYGEKLASNARKQLAKNTLIMTGKDGLINIEVDDEDPKRAAAIANGYHEELGRLTRTLAVSEASQRRLFFEKQLLQAREELTKAEFDLQKTQEKTGVIQLEGQARAIIEGVAQLRAQIAAKEVQLGSMRTFATAQNPDYQRAQQELAGLRAQLKGREQEPGDKGDVMVATGKVPQIGLENLRKMREVKYHEAIMEIMARQFELAKVDEAKDSAVIQVVDNAIEPDRKSKPKQAVFTLVAFFGALLIALVLVFLLESKEKFRAEYKNRSASL
ncbi:MAG: Wzz/FepE/Etk N-terminal domain-containing protein [Burkholderiales bacterium]